MEKFWKMIMKWCINRGRVVNIMDRDEKEVYMIRYIVFKSKFFSIYIHRFLQSDDDVHHDHPWNFFTYIISGGYREEVLRPDMDKGLLKPHLGTRKQGSLAFRRAEDTHRVILDRSYRVSEQEVAPLTACFIFRRRRVWGFKKPVYSKSYKIRQVNGQDIPDLDESRVVGYEWINWKDYLGIYPGDPRYHGSE